MKNIALLIIGTFVLIHSQIFLNANNIEKSEQQHYDHHNDNNYNGNFQQRINYFDKFLSTFDELPKGWKQIKREEIFWQNKITPDGKIVSPKLLVNELRSVLNKKSKQINSNNFNALYDWEAIGPFEVPDIGYYHHGNGCVCCIAVDPENENIIWLGSASGGIWKSEDKGNSWQVIPFTDMLSSGIMDIAISPSNPNIMYAASGSPFGTGLFKSFSIGVLKSIDRGKTWNIMNETLDYADSAGFYSILIHPENPDIVYVGTTKSILKTTNGGNDWSVILDDYYFRELKFKPNNPNVIYACSQTTWNTGGAQIFVSEDAGNSWEITKTFPNARRIELAVTAQNPELVYAITGNGTYEHNLMGMEGFYVSRSGGKDWDTVLNCIRDSSSPNFNNFVYAQSYHNLSVAISPKDENFIVAGGVYLAFSIDGGKTWTRSGGNSVHVDVQHLVFLDTIIYCANDGGINWIHCDSLYNNFSKKEDIDWKNITNGLNITQYSRLGAHPYTDKFIIAGCQDNGVHFMENGKWRSVSTGDGMECQFNSKRPSEYFLSTQRGGGVSNGIDDSFIFNTNYIVSPLTPDTMLICATNLWLRNLANPTVKPQKISDFSQYEQTGLRAIAVSKSNKNYIYTSSRNNLFYTKDYAATWQEIYYSNPPITYITVDPNDPEHFWISLGGNYKNEKVIEFLNGVPKDISYDLPNVSINCIEYYPKENILFVGTDIGIFMLELNENANSWQNFNLNNLPYVCIHELEYVPRTGYMYAATWGRGIWKIKLHNCDAVTPKIASSIIPDETGKIIVCNSDLPIKLFNIDKKADYHYFWSDGSTEDTISILKKGRYFLVGISPEGCSEISQIINVELDFIPINSLIRLIALGRNPVCVGKTTRYKYQISNYGRAMGVDTSNFQWSNGSKESTVTISEPTDLSIYYTNPRGCVDTLFITSIEYVDLPSVPQITQKGNILLVTNNTNKQYHHFQWLLNGEKIDQAFDDTITITSLGNYQVTAWNKNYCSETSEAYSINFNDSENNEWIKVKLYPNPSSGNIQLELFLEDELDISIKMYDINGKEMLNFAIPLKNYYTTEFNVLPFASGHYFLKISGDNYSRTVPFVIAK